MATDAEQGWASWAGVIAKHWTDEFQSMFDDAVTAFSSTVEAMTPAAAKRLADDFYALIWGSGASLLQLRDNIQDGERQAAALGIDLDATRGRVTEQLRQAGDVDAIPLALSGPYADGRSRFYAMGFMRGTSADPNVGIVPILVAGLVVSVAALCWCKVRMTEALVDQRRWAWMDAALKAEIKAKRDGTAPPDWQAIAAAANAATPNQAGADYSWLGGTGGYGVPVAAGVALLVGLAVLMRR